MFVLEFLTFIGALSLPVSTITKNTSDCDQIKTDLEMLSSFTSSLLSQYLVTCFYRHLSDLNVSAKDNMSKQNLSKVLYKRSYLYG